MPSEDVTGILEAVNEYPVEWRMINAFSSFDVGRQIKWRDHFADQGPYTKSFGFSSSDVWMWKLDHKESWAPKNWRLQIVVLEKTCTARRSNQSILKQISPEYSLERLMLKLKLQYIDHLMQRAGLIGKDPYAGKDWGQEEKGAAEDKIASLTQWTWIWTNSGRRWRTEESGMVVIPWDHKESDMTYWLNSNNKRRNRWKSSGHGAATQGECQVAFISKYFMKSIWLHLLFLLLGHAVQPFSTSCHNCHQLQQPGQTASTQWALNTRLPNELCLLLCSKGCCIDCSIFKKKGGWAAY